MNKPIRLPITLYWTKYHFGTIANEKADEYAKKACLKEHIDYHFELSNYSIKKELETKFLEHWQYYWDNSYKCRGTWNLIPRVKQNVIYSDFFLNQVITRHGVFPGYQEKYFNKSDLCICLNNKGAVEHIILDSPIWNDIRKYFHGVNTIQNLLLNKGGTLGVRTIIQAYFELVVA